MKCKYKPRRYGGRPHIVPSTPICSIHSGDPNLRGKLRCSALTQWLHVSVGYCKALQGLEHELALLVVAGHSPNVVPASILQLHQLFSIRYLSSARGMQKLTLEKRDQENVDFGSSAPMSSTAKISPRESFKNQVSRFAYSSDSPAQLAFAPKAGLSPPQTPSPALKRKRSRASNFEQISEQDNPQFPPPR